MVFKKNAENQCGDIQLVGACFSLFKLLYKIQYEDRDFSFQDFRFKILNEFLLLKEGLLNSGISEFLCKEIQFIMSAFADEIILKQDNDLSHRWSKESLQSYFFGENIGGEKFFEKLSYFKNISEKRLDILEIFYWCLVLGYQGKYAKREIEQLSVIKEELIGIIKFNNKKSADQHFVDTLSYLDDTHEKTGYFLKKISSKNFVISLLLSGLTLYGIQFLWIQYLLDRIN